MRRRRKRRFDRPLRVSIAERTGWSPPKLEAKPHPRLTTPTRQTRRVLDALAALPKLAATVGLVVAAHPNAAVEVLPGDNPSLVAFTAGNQLKGLFVLPASEREVREAIGLPAVEFRDHHADRLWEEERHDAD